MLVSKVKAFESTSFLTVVRTSRSWSRRLSPGKSSWIRWRSPSSWPRCKTAPLPTPPPPLPPPFSTFRASCPRYLSYSASLWTCKKERMILHQYRCICIDINNNLVNGFIFQGRRIIIKRRSFHSFDMQHDEFARCQSDTLMVCNLPHSRCVCVCVSLEIHGYTKLPPE